MSNDNIVNLSTAKNSDLATLKAKAADLKSRLANKLVEVVAILEEASEAGLTPEFNFSKTSETKWQVSLRIVKDF